MDPICCACFIRDGWKCRHCNDRNGIHSHHIIHKSQGGSNALNNRLTLCFICHRAYHDGKLQIDVIGITCNNIIVKFTRLKGWKPD